MNILEHTKDQFGIDIEKSSFRAKITGKMSDLGLAQSDELNESIKERLEAIYEEFGVRGNNNSITEEELLSIYEVGSAFGIKLKSQADDEIMEKLEIINLFSKVHGYDLSLTTGRGDVINNTELNKIKIIYASFNKELKDLKLEDLYKIKKYELVGLSNLKQLSKVEAEHYSEFIISLGINLTLSKEEAKNVREVGEVIEDLGYSGSTFLESKELKKITDLLEKFNLKSISNWNKESGAILSQIIKEFDIDLKEGGSFRLKKKIKAVEILKLTEVKNIEELNSKLQIIKSFKSDLEEVNQKELEDLSIIIKELELSKGNEGEGREVKRWFERKGIEFNLGEMDEETSRQMRALKKKLEAATNKEWKEISIREISLTEQILEAFEMEDIMNSTAEQIAKISNLINSVSEEALGADVGYNLRGSINKLPSLLEIFKIDPFEKSTKKGGVSKYDSIANLLKEFDKNIFEISESEASRMLSTFASFGADIASGFVTSDMKSAIKEAIEGFEYKGIVEIDEREVEKIMMLSKAMGLDFKDIKTSDIKVLKLIPKTLDLTLKGMSIGEMENVLYLIEKIEIKKASGEQGWISYLTKGGGAAIIEKLEALKEKIKLLGYESSTEITKGEYEGIEELLKEWEKDFKSISVEELKAVTSTYLEFKYSMAKEPLYKLIGVARELKSLNLSPFTVSKIEKNNIRVIEEKYKTRIGEFTQEEMSKIIDNFSKYKVEIKSKEFENSIRSLEESYVKMGFKSSLKLGKESEECMKLLEKALDKSGGASNLEKLEKVTNIIAKLAGSIEEYGLEECVNLEVYLSKFNVDLEKVEMLKYKQELITEVSKKCKLDFTEPVGEKILSNIEEKISEYKVRQEFLDNRGISSKKEESKKVDISSILDANEEAIKICANYHEDL